MMAGLGQSLLPFLASAECLCGHMFLIFRGEGRVCVSLDGFECGWLGGEEPTRSMG